MRALARTTALRTGRTGSGAASGAFASGQKQIAAVTPTIITQPAILPTYMFVLLKFLAEMPCALYQKPRLGTSEAGGSLSTT